VAQICNVLKQAAIEEGQWAEKRQLARLASAKSRDG